MSTYISLKKVSLTAYLFCFILAAPLICKSQNSPFYKEAYERTINLDFEYQALKTHTPSSPGEAFIFHYRLTLAYLVTENAELIDLLEDNESLIEDLINQLQGPWRRFFLAEIKLRSAFINLKLGNELSAAWNIRQAYKLTSENTELYPKFVNNKKTSGLLHVLIGSIPEQYQWVLNLMGMNGDVQTGLNELAIIATNNDVFSIEAGLLSRVIDAYLLNNSEQATDNIEQILDGGPLLSYIGMAIAMKNSDASMAISIYEKTLNKSQNPLLAYLAGEAHLQLGNYNKARNSLETFLATFKGENFIKDTYYKLGLAALLQQDLKKAESLFLTAQNRGQTLTEADKHAQRMIENGLPDPAIMQIRLFTDGGQFQKADSIIKLVDDEQLKINDQLEFTYRKARLQHKLGEYPIAIGLYKNVISLQQNDAYFAPNSCLQLGYIYNAQGNEEQAKYFFEKVLSYKHHAYKNSLDNKAKTALKSIKNTSR